jgi:hypothetical protein
MTLDVFCHPTVPHVRRHGPRGYNPYGGYKPWLRDEFWFRCVYCLERERWYPDRAASFSVDHVISQSESPDRICDYTNLVYACTRCNSIRRHVRLIDPTEQAFGKNIRLGSDALFVSLTPDGQDVIDNLRLNKDPALQERKRVLRIMALYTNHADDPDVKDLYLDVFGYPEELPDLPGMRPPGGNTLPDGVNTCFFVQKKLGTLPDFY